MFAFCFATMFLFNNGICIMLNSDMLSSMFVLGFANSVGFWVGMSAISVPSLSGTHVFPHANTTSIAQSKKTSGTHTDREIKEIALATGFSQPGIRASKTFRPPVPWCKFSAQQDCIGRRNAARHQAPPSVTPVWKLLEPKETVSTTWANFGGQIIKVFWPKARNKGLQFALGSLSGEC